MSFSFDIPEDPSTSAEFLTTSDSAINFFDESKSQTRSTVSQMNKVTKELSNNNNDAGDTLPGINVGLSDTNSHESGRISEVESSQDVTSPGFSEGGSIASPRFDFDQPLKNNYYDYLAPSASRANEVYYRLNLSSLPNHSDNSPVGNVPSDTEAGFIDEDSVLEYYPTEYADR